MLRARGILCGILITLALIRAELPAEYSIPAFNGDAIRDAYAWTARFELLSDQEFHPYFIESVNAILKTYGNADTLNRHMSGNSDTTLGYYFSLLENAGIEIHSMSRLQGKSLRALIAGGIPVLILGAVDTHEYRKKRVYADVIHRYRRPFQKQSSRILPEDVEHLLCSVRGFHLKTREMFPPVSWELLPEEEALVVVMNKYDEGILRMQARQDLQEFRSRKWIASPLKRPPFDTFGYFCVVTTKDRTLDQIRKVIEKGLSDVGFKYKVPEFRQVEGASLSR